MDRLLLPRIWSHQRISDARTVLQQPRNPLLDILSTKKILLYVRKRPGESRSRHVKGCNSLIPLGAMQRRGEFFSHEHVVGLLWTAHCLQMHGPKAINHRG